MYSMNVVFVLVSVVISGTSGGKDDASSGEDDRIESRQFAPLPPPPPIGLVQLPPLPTPEPDPAALLLSDFPSSQVRNITYRSKGSASSGEDDHIESRHCAPLPSPPPHR